MVGMSGSSGPPGLSPGILEKAETFTETDVNVADSTATARNESIRLAWDQSTASPPDLTGTTTTIGGGSAGLVVNPNYPIEELVLTKSSNTTDNNGIYARVYKSDGTQIGSADFTSGTATISGLELSAGTDYHVMATGLGSSSFDCGRASAGSTPHSSTLLDITAGATMPDGGNPSTDSTYLYAIESVVAKGRVRSSGSTTAEIAAPDDIFAWDIASFIVTQDGGSVSIGLEENDGTGWSTIATDIGRGQEITADKDSNVRFTIDISRSDPTQVPRVEALYRRRTI